MDDTPHNGHANGEDFLKLLEDGVRDIVKNRKSTKPEKIKALEVGVKVAAIRHKVAEPDAGFFK